MTRSAVQSLFVAAGVYDFVIGLAFLFFGPQIFVASNVPPPNHWGYIQFAALLLMVFGLMFFAVARDPARNRNLIPFGMLLKLSYVGIVAYYWVSTGCPTLFKPFAVIDAAMFLLFWWAYSKQPAAAAGP